MSKASKKEESFKIDTIPQNLGFQGVNTLEDFFELTLRDLFILFVIQRNKTISGRNAFREEVNSYLKNDLKPSSFYSTLDKLEKFKYIEYDRTNKMIKVKPEVERAFTEITMLTFVSLIDYKDVTETLIKMVIQKTQKTSFNNIMIISLEPLMDVSIYNTIASLSNQATILSTDLEYKGLITRNLDKKIIQSKLITDSDNFKIREPDNFFDGIIILGYNCITQSKQTNLKDLMDEINRVLQSKGYLFLSAFENISEDKNHIFLRNLKRLFQRDSFNEFVNKEEIKSDLEYLKLTSIDIIEFDGLLVGWGIKSE